MKKKKKIIMSLDIETNTLINEKSEVDNVEVYSCQIMFFELSEREKFAHFCKNCGTMSWQELQNYQGWKPHYVRKKSLTDGLDYMKELIDIYGEYTCYVHNLAYEGDFIIKCLGDGVHALTHKIDRNGNEKPGYFATEPHKFLRIDIDNGIEIKCSYRLTNKSLAVCGHEVGIEKGTDYSYKDYHNPLQPLTDDEELYCYRDVWIVLAKLMQLESVNNMTVDKFPLTSTAFIRNRMREKCLEDESYRYNYLKEQLNGDKYIMLREAFAGGDTSASVDRVGKWFDNVASFDITSSYPAQMLLQKFPVGQCYKCSKNIKKVEKEYKSGKWLHVLRVCIYDIVARYAYKTMSISKCRNVVDGIEANGRVHKAKSLEITLTDVDLFDYIRFYKINKIIILDGYVWKAGKLPKPILEDLLIDFIKKQELKPLTKQDNCDSYILTEYNYRKEGVNSRYGVMVEDLYKQACFFDEDFEWQKDRTVVDMNEIIAKYYKKHTSFLQYHWGVFIPCWARKQLHDMQLISITDLIYSDTDSLKVLHPAENKIKFEWYNKNTIKPLLDACKKEWYSVFGEKINLINDLGSFDFEGTYKHFKTLGAKKYAYQKETGDIAMTVSGLSKKVLRNVTGTAEEKYTILQKLFQVGTVFTEDVSGRTVAHYITNNNQNFGNGGIGIEGTSYTLGISRNFVKFLENSWNTGKRSIQYYEYNGKEIKVKTAKIEHVLENTLCSLSEKQLQQVEKQCDFAFA